jgi:sugar O-acyltransferase (sialic acid O-acetyltransferase NeuD family)
MKDIIIVGAGGCAREVLQWIRDINRVSPQWNILGFIADDIDTALVGKSCDYRVIDTIVNYHPKDTDHFVCAVGTPRGKEKVVRLLKGRGARFVSIVHPKALIGDGCQIGEGFIAYPYSVVSVGARLGDFVTLLSSSLGVDSTIGDYSTISSYCNISNNVSLGRFAELGSHVTIPDKVSVGEGAFLAAGCVVMEDVPEGARLWGNPAVPLPF